MAGFALEMREHCRVPFFLAVVLLLACGMTSASARALTAPTRSYAPPNKIEFVAYPLGDDILPPESRNGLFVSNNPINWVDPNGTITIQEMVSWGISLLTDKLGIGREYTGSIPECPAIGGYYTHCVNVCLLQKLTLGQISIGITAANLFIAMYAGDDLTQNHQTDWQANIRGIINAYSPQSCFKSCDASLKYQSSKYCCPSEPRRDKTDPNCCDK